MSKQKKNQKKKNFHTYSGELSTLAILSVCCTHLTTRSCIGLHDHPQENHGESVPEHFQGSQCVIDWTLEARKRENKGMSPKEEALTTDDTLSFQVH